VGVVGALLCRIKIDATVWSWSEAMKYVQASLGLHTAEAEKVAISFADGELRLSFVDWQGQRGSATFSDVLAFRWQELDDPVPRDDSTFEAVGSPWLERQAKLHGVRGDNYAHYVLCFNACGALDLVARRISDGDAPPLARP
jgi:hypothetical protein